MMIPHLGVTLKEVVAQLPILYLLNHQSWLMTGDLLYSTAEFQSEMISFSIKDIGQRGKF